MNPDLRLETVEAEVEPSCSHTHNLAEVTKLFAPLRECADCKIRSPGFKSTEDSPTFKFQYPADSRPEPMFGFSKIADIDRGRTGKSRFNVWEIPGGVALEDVGTSGICVSPGTGRLKSAHHRERGECDAGWYQGTQTGIQVAVAGR